MSGDGRDARDDREGLAASRERDEPGDLDDLAGFTSPLTRLVTAGRTWLIVLVVVALVVPGVAFVVDEFAYRRSAGAVVATLDGERVGAEAAETVLLVRARGCDGRVATGTAFVVETAAGPALLTNRHVVEGSRHVGVRHLDGSTEVEVTEVSLSRSADVAVLAVADPDALPPPLALRLDRPASEEPVRLIGFPAATPFTDAGTVVAAEQEHLVLDVEVASGASGSPVVAEDGRVVGQVFATNARGLGLATSAARLSTAIEDVDPQAPC